MGGNKKQKKILLIDDEEGLLILLTRRLESWGYQVLTALDGEEGLQKAEREQPDLILLDIVLPNLRGREVCQRLKLNPKTKHLPVIFFTALGMPEHIEAGFNSGADDYVVKPFDPRDLRERIQECLLRNSGVFGRAPSESLSPC